ncbi:hypothetical protein GCM10025792_04900 [Pseudonocardia tropica]
MARAVERRSGGNTRRPRTELRETERWDEAPRDQRGRSDVAEPYAADDVGAVGRT